MFSVGVRISKAGTGIQEHKQYCNCNVKLHLRFIVYLELLAYYGIFTVEAFSSVGI